MRWTPTTTWLPALCAVAVLGTAPAAAQTTLPFDALSSALSPGTDVRVETAGGRVDGVLKALDAGALVLTLDGGRERTFTPAEVRRVRVHDGIADGLTLGALAGAAPGLLTGRVVYGLCRGEGASVARCLPAFALPMAAGGAVGALLGLALDDVSLQAIDVAGAAGARITATPSFTRERRALWLRASW